MARSVLTALDYKLPISFVNQLVTFCIFCLNVQTTSSLTGNWCPRVRMTGRKVDFKKEYALTFGDYVEARNPKVISNSMEPRTDGCIALYPTLNVNGSWKLYNLRTNRIVSRSQYSKTKHTPDNIIQLMNALAVKGNLKPSDIDNQQEIINVEEIVEEPPLQTHVPDPNVIEILGGDDGASDGDEEEVPLESNPTMEPEVQTLVEEPAVDEALIEEADEAIEVAAVPTRRSGRANAGRSSKYEPYAMMTQGYGLACTSLRVKVARERFGKIAYDAIKEELIQLLIKKRALVPINVNEVMEKIGHGNLWYHSVRSHTFLKEKYDAGGNFEKIKARLVADGSTQDRSDFDEEDIASPTASLESIFNMLKLVAMEKRHLLILDIGGAFLNAEIDRTVYMFIEPELVNIMVNMNSGYAKYRDVKGRILTQIDKTMYGLVQSAKLWYETITGVLKGYTPNPMDPCVWNKVVGGDQITIVIYVDDLAISC